MKIEVLNESWIQISGSFDLLKEIYELLAVHQSGYEFSPQYKSGLWDGKKRFCKVKDGSLLVPRGLGWILKRQYGEIFDFKRDPLYKEEEIEKYLSEISGEMPFPPRDYQSRAFKDSIINYSQISLMATGSGKSATIAMVADFLTKRGLRGLLIVPNINLLSQFHSDILEYNLQELYEGTHLIGGDNKIKHLDSKFTISTWQSLQNMDASSLRELDFVIGDEFHKARGEIFNRLFKDAVNAKWRLGFTGTLPEDPADKMSIYELCGEPKHYIRSGELIRYGIGCPIEINAILLESGMRAGRLKYNEKLKNLKENSKRTHWISALASKLAGSSGNTLVLYQHTEHGKDIFKSVMAGRGIEVKNAQITGKNALTHQKEWRVYFINGEVDGSTREEIRQILEHDTDAVIVANYAVLSTGVNIKNLHNLVLASPLKSYTTITQSIGRGIRTHHSKEVFRVFDVVDMLEPFKTQYNERKRKSYDYDGFPVLERSVKL